MIVNWGAVSWIVPDDYSGEDVDKFPPNIIVEFIPNGNDVDFYALVDETIRGGSGWTAEMQHGSGDVITIARGSLEYVKAEAEKHIAARWN